MQKFKLKDLYELILNNIKRRMKKVLNNCIMHLKQK